MTIDKNKIKDAIKEYEYYRNGFHKLCGRYVKVSNLVITKERYIADITLGDTEDKTSERYDECEYRREDIDNMINKKVVVV